MSPGRAAGRTRQLSGRRAASTNVGPATTIRTTILQPCTTGFDPLNSADESHCTSGCGRPRGQPAWVEYTFRKPTPVSTPQRSTGRTIAGSAVFRRRGGAVPRMVPRGSRLKRRRRSRWRRTASTASDFEPVTTTAVPIEVEPATRHYKSGEIGPPDAMFLDAAIAWREFGIVEFRVR